MIDGGCLCGAVRYRIDGAPVDAGFCHCRLCQRSTGAPVTAWLTVARGGFSYTKGRAASFASSLAARREFCTDCGTQLVFREADSELLDVTVASLDDPTAVEPEYHIWAASRIRWLHLDDSLPVYADAGPDDRGTKEVHPS